MINQKLKNFFKKAWFVLWKDDSLKGWIISIVFIFIMLKFVFFPLLSLASGTSLPLAIVESCSMYHQGNLFSNSDSWWENHKGKYEQFGINDEEFKNFGFKKGFNKGDILFITRANPDELKVGDTIIFNAGSNNPIIHRIVKIEETTQGKIFSTMGDNNLVQLKSPLLLIDETNIREAQLVGKARFRIMPYIGWIKLVAADVINWIIPPMHKEDFRYLNEGFCKAN